MMEPKVKDSASYTVLAQPSASTSTSFGRGGLLSEVEVVEVTTESKCATWSHCPARSNWEIIMMLKNQTPEDLHTRIGFAITVNIRGRKGSKHEVEANSDMESYHDLMDLPLFIDLLERGSNFTKLELEGDFFNNVDLCPEDMTPNSVVTQLITIQNLKTLSIKAKLTLPLKGLDEATQHGYYSLHRDHCNAFKSRAARNLWYIFKAFECPILSVLEIMDCMEWEDPDLIESGFFYWDQPLMSFLQRHAPTLRSLKTSPIIGMQIDDMTNGNFEADASIPIVEDLLFWTKLRLKNFSKTPDSQKEITFQIEVEKTLRPWRKFLEAQNNLKTLILITDEDSPWTLVRRDFVNVATKNSALEAVMVALYGDEEFRKAHGLPEQQPNKGTIKDYQIDAAVVHGMLSLRILSIGCYGNDPQVKNFSLINLHLLPGTLDTIQFFGVRVMATELESLAKLPRLKSLALIQGKKTTYTEEDELNDNIEGVTAPVLQALLTQTRNLEKLLIVGFPISSSKAEMLSSQGKSDSSPTSRGWFEGIFGGMCYPTIAGVEDPISSNANTTPPHLPSLAQYSEPLQELMTFVATGMGNVSEVVSDYENKEHPMTMLSIGR